MKSKIGNLVTPKKVPGGSEDSRIQLQEKDEFLLVKYIDDECGFIERIIARRLIARNPQAASFVVSMRSLSNEFASTKRDFQEYDVDLWGRINDRIEQEEKAEFYLGRRVEGVAEPKVFWDWSKINLGIGTGLAAAGLSLFFFQNLKGTESPTASLASPSNSIESPIEMMPIKLAGNEPIAAPSIPKVDWVRSHGKIRMIKDPNERRLPVIWVNRNLSEKSRSLPNHDLFDLIDDN